MTNDQLVPADVMGRFFREAVRHHLDEAGHTASVYPAWEEIGDNLKTASTAAMGDLYGLLLAHFDRAAGTAIAEARAQAGKIITANRELRAAALAAVGEIRALRVPLSPQARALVEAADKLLPADVELAILWPIGTPVWYRRYGDGPWEQSTTKTVPWTTANGVTWVTVEAVPAQAGAALTLGGLRTLDNPPPDTELEPPTTPL